VTSTVTLSVERRTDNITVDALYRAYIPNTPIAEFHPVLVMVARLPEIVPATSEKVTDTGVPDAFADVAVTVKL
jgi:hypothetical protein